MSEFAPKAELMRSLGQVVRGLSALFWGLPLALLVCIRTALSEWLRPLGMAPPILATSLLVYGLWQLSFFQKQERVWRNAVDRAQILGIINVGLSPFIFWWNRLPEVRFYVATVFIMMVTGLLFLCNLNRVLQRLVAMLPDETLRAETAFFTRLNLFVLSMMLGFILLFLLLQNSMIALVLVSPLLRVLRELSHFILVAMILLPVAMTMTLIWKIKEVVFASVFGNESW